MKLELDAAGGMGAAPLAERRPEPDLVEFAPRLLPPKLFKSKTFNPAGKVRVTPVLTPDNYMDVVPRLLASAEKSVLIEQQYIRSAHAEVATLLAAVKAARERNPDLDVRIILGKLFGPADFEKEKENVANLRQAFGLRLGENVRYIDLRRFVHCHNKMAVVDGKAVLVSSQNWSRTGVGTNREAGLVIRYPELARYYARVFESDWATALRQIPNPGAAEFVTPGELARGRFVEVRAADYQEV
jgi:phosphatidylserine/phosphatidylglycerophosphate/cardiolipin synthase-like enzyme